MSPLGNIPPATFSLREIGPSEGSGIEEPLDTVYRGPPSRPRPIDAEHPENTYGTVWKVFFRLATGAGKAIAAFSSGKRLRRDQ
jgi:hypothetical protein